MAGQDGRRYRGVEHIDPGELRQKVSEWLDEHPGGTAEQITADLAAVYPGYHQGDLAIVLRAALFTEMRERQR